MKELWPRVVKYYGYAALMFFNLFLLFVCINLAIVAYGVVEPEAVAAPTPPIPSAEDLRVGFQEGSWQVLGYESWDDLRNVHYYMSQLEMVWMLIEYNNVMACDENTGWRVPAYNGVYHNIDQAGFRAINSQRPWPPPDDHYVIFIFGGSTTFGTYLPDNATIPSHLFIQITERYSVGNIAVYNFGVPGFYSVQERLLLESLLDDGYTPDLAIFIDGLNDSNFVTRSPQSFLRICNDVQNDLRNTVVCRHDELCLPSQRALAHLINPVRANDNARQIGDTADAERPPVTDDAANRSVVARWIENRAQVEALAEQHGFRTLYVLQPTPGYAYDLDYHLWLPNENPTIEDLGFWGRTHYTYPLWQDMAADADWAHNFLDLSRMAEDFTWNIWVDQVHYTNGFGQQIAQAIVDDLDERGWVRDALFE